MKEFKLWDTKLRCFVQTLPIDLSISLDGELKTSNRVTAFKYIGKNDINNEEIYADCSIIEFDIFADYRNVTLIGAFTYNSDELRYEIDILDKKSVYCCLSYNPSKITNIKIIDTIQENNLGLINE